MKRKLFDRNELIFYPLEERKNRVSVDSLSAGVTDTALAESLGISAVEAVRRAAADIGRARTEDRPVILTFGAHTIKNGLGPVLIALMENGWVTHLATNGAGIIHDWELAFQGKTSENVRENVAGGMFGMWEETGTFINLALLIGAYRGLGYGEAVGAFIEEEELTVPEPEYLFDQVRSRMTTRPMEAAAALDLFHILRENKLQSGVRKIPHPFKRFSVQAAAYRLGIPLTGHPMFGHDIIYTHPLNCGAAIGRTAELDFLSFVSSVADIENGVYLSVGSAVMSPMIFEKSFSMAQNRALQRGTNIRNHSMYVVDLMEVPLDWSGGGEPGGDNPAYYLRFCKSFARMGGRMEYIQADNRDFLPALYKALEELIKF